MQRGDQIIFYGGSSYNTRNYAKELLLSFSGINTAAYIIYIASRSWYPGIFAGSNFFGFAANSKHFASFYRISCGNTKFLHHCNVLIVERINL